MVYSDTIFALSSGGLPSGVAVIRISGPATFEVVEDLCGSVPRQRLATLRTIRDRNKQILDQGLVITFAAPASFTGENCAELQIHGGRAVVAALLDDLSHRPGLRHAEPGEFSRRAFENGKLDLVEIEGLSDLISAETEMQRRLALEHSSGHLSTLYDGWARRLTHARAMIEAELDFADEDDVPGSVADAIWEDMSALSNEISTHITGGKIAEIIRDGLKIVIAGEPNVGKSSLLNHIAKRDVAIVTDVAGTTRDVLSIDVTIAGFAVTLFDTAGLRETDDVVEREGIRRARLSLENADLVLLLSDHPDRFPQANLGNAPNLRVATKIDAAGDSWDKANFDVGVSTVTGVGFDKLMSIISGHLPDLSGAGALSLPSRQRHVSLLMETRQSIDLAFAQSNSGLDIRAEFLRHAGTSLGRITGKVDVEDLLGVIFSEFCIGK